MEKTEKRITVLTLALIFIVSFLGGISLTVFASAPKVIQISEKGFAPDQITIAKGQRVLFTNKDTVDHWPASDSHPTHDIYSAFDPKEPISPGKQWLFTFNDVGEWEFHDHLNPLFTGKIIVTGKTNSQQATTTDCSTSSNKYQCWDKLFDSIIEQKGLQQAFQTLEEVYLSDNEFAGNCHGYVHKLGEEAYKLFSKGQDVPITDKASYCAYGFYHGFIETLLHTTSNLQTARDFCKYVDDNSKGPAGAFFACYHGIGHGVVDGSDERAWGDDFKMVQPGLVLCEEVSPDNTLKDACASGVFNSIAVLYKDPQYKLEFRKDDPYGLCENEYIKHYPYLRKPCVEEMNTYVLSVAENELKRAAGFVEKITDKQSAIYAIQSVAGYYAYFSQDPKQFVQTINICKSLPLFLHDGCLTGYAAGLVEHGKPGVEYENALAFCKNNNLVANERYACLNRIYYYFSNLYSDEKLREVCAYAKEENISYCKN